MIVLIHATSAHPEEETFLRTAAFAASLTVLPLIAGYRVAKGRASLLMSAGAGASISLASIATVGVIYATTNAPLEAFLGYILATVLIAIIPQLVFAVAGFKWCQRRAVGDI